MIAKTIAELKELSKVDLEVLHDRNTGNSVLGLKAIRQEIEWREQKEATDRMEALTQNMEQMTRSIKWLTVTAVLFGATSLILSAVVLLKDLNP